MLNLTRLAIIAAVCCVFASGAVFDPYSRRFRKCESDMGQLLQTPSGSSSCNLIAGLNALPSKAALTSAQNTTYTTWVKSIETEIVKNISISTNEAKFKAIAASFEEFSVKESAIYTKVQYLNISTWGPVDTVVQISTEWNFQYSLELVVASDSKGNCKLFDRLLSACQGDTEKHQALKDFIDSDLKIVVKDKTKSQKEVIRAVYKALKEKFFVGTRASWMSYFYTLKLDGYFSLSQWSKSAVTFERQATVEVTLSGQGMDCPFILAMNASLSSSSYTLTQKGFIKQLMNYFIQQWTTTTTFEARMTLISMKFSESIDLSYSYFGCLNSIQIQGFGSWWELIIFTCHKERIPQTCGCAVPTFSDEVTTTPMAPTTEMPLEITTEMPIEMTSESATEATTEVSTEVSTEGTTETSSTSGSTWDSTFSSITFPSTTEGCTCTCEM